MAASSQKLDYWQLVRDVRFGSKMDIDCRPVMSALPPKADIG
jgi:hypothetical protein